MAVRDDEKVGYPEIDTFSFSTWLFLSLDKQRENGVCNLKEWVLGWVGKSQSF